MKPIDADPIIAMLKAARKKADSPRRDLDLLNLQQILELAPTVVVAPLSEDTLKDCISKRALLEKIDGIWDCNDMVFEGPRDHSCRPEDCKGCHWHDTKQYIRKLIANMPAIAVQEGRVQV